MSGRIVNLVPWAVGNYPVVGQPWDSTPLRVLPTAQFFTPGQLAGPQPINWQLGVMTDAINGLANGGAGAGAAQIWPYIDLPANGTNTPMYGAAYDPAYGRMYVYGGNTANNGYCVYMSRDFGKTWVTQGGQEPAGTHDAVVQCIIARPSDGRLGVATYIGAGDVSPVTDEFTRVPYPTSTANVSGVFFNNLFCFIGKNTTAVITVNSGGVATTYTAGVTAATWAAQTTFTAASPSFVMAVAGVISQTTWIGSADGVTWVNGTIPLGTEFAVGIAYAADRWAVAVTDGTNSRILTSQNNGTTWTVAATLTGHVLGGLGACGALLFATDYTHLGLRGAYSIDGGVTWKFGSQYNAPASGSSPDPVYSMGGLGFVTATGTHFSVSAPQGVYGT